MIVTADLSLGIRAQVCEASRQKDRVMFSSYILRLLYALLSTFLYPRGRFEERSVRCETPDSTLEKAESLVESYQASQRFENRAHGKVESRVR